MKWLFLLLAFTPLSMYAQKDAYKDGRVVFKEITVKQFLERVQEHHKDDGRLNAVYYTYAAPKDWIKKEDIPVLMGYIASQAHCRCVISLLSSYAPMGDAHSTLGGIAMDMIDAYRKGVTYPQQLALCTRTDRERIAATEKWWQQENK